MVEKVRLVDMLKKSLKTALSEKNDIKSLRNYIKSMKDLENVDFKIEIEKCE